MQKQDNRRLLVTCFAIKYIYAIDGDGLNGSGWNDVGHLKWLQLPFTILPALYIVARQQLAVNFKPSSAH